MDDLSSLPLQEQNEHLKWSLKEINTLPEPEAEEARDLWRAGLSVSEERVLALLVRRKGHVVTRNALIAAMTWDRPAAEPTPKIVNTHVCRIRQKLRKAGIHGEIKTYACRGYLWEPA